MAAEAAFDLKEEDNEPVLEVRGDWTVDTIAMVERAMRDVAETLGAGAELDGAGLGRLDVAGAYLIDRTLRGGVYGANLPLRMRGQHPTAKRLLETARAAAAPPEAPPEEIPGFVGFLDRVGREVAN